MTLKFKIPKLKHKDIDNKGLKHKRKFSKKVIIISIIVILVVSYFTVSKAFMPTPQPIVKCTPFLKGNIINNINVLGRVESETSTNIYTTLNYPVKEIKVKVGDEVKTGDVLAILDSSSLETEIEQAEAEIVKAEADAKADVDSKKDSYENDLYLYNNNLNTELTNATSAVDSAKFSIDDKEKVYEYNKKLFQYGEISEQELKQKEMEFQNAKSEYDKAIIALESKKIKVQQELKTAKSTYEVAKRNMNDNSKRIALEKQKSDLAKCQITASVDGTITSMNAVVGNPSTGSLFIIEDLNKITITALIKQVDIANIKVGQKVEVKTDALGDNSIDGEVITVDPTAKKQSMSTNLDSSQQSTGGSGDLNFEAKVKVNEPNDKIKVGMEAKLNIILNEKSDIYTVQHESIIQDGDNKSIFIAEKNGQNYIIKQMPVTIGLESDFKVEVSGDGILDGQFVVDDSSTCKVGDIVNVEGGEAIE